MSHNACLRNQIFTWFLLCARCQVPVHLSDEATLVHTTAAAIPRGNTSASSLVDGDPNTIWRPSSSVGVHSLVLDIGSVATVTAVTVLGEQRPFVTSPLAILLGNDCNAMAIPMTSANVTHSSGGVIKLLNPQSARYVIVRGTGSNFMPGIRGVAVSVVALTGEAQSVTVEVGGAHGAACASGCVHNYTAAPVATSVKPVEVSVGSAVNVSVSDLTSCTGLTVRVGESACEQTYCVPSSGGPGFVVCTVPAVKGGTHPLSVMVDGLGSAAGSLSLRVATSVVSVTPSSLGLGGGTLVTIAGSGFPAASPNVKICGAKCTPTSFNDNTIVCEHGVVGDRSRLPLRRSIDVKVQSKDDDAFEYVAGGHIEAYSATLGFTASIRQTDSWQKAYIRFPLDIPFNSTVTMARLHLIAAKPSCSKGSRLSISIQVCIIIIPRNSAPEPCEPLLALQPLYA